MNIKSPFFTVSAVALLAACGGGGTSTDANGISTAPLSGPELERIGSDIASATGSAVGAEELLSFSDTVGDLNETDLAVRDVRVAGSATYNGMVFLADVDLSSALAEAGDLGPDDELEEPVFVVLGRSTMRVAFGESPSITGGANGFIGLNADAVNDTEALTSLGEAPSDAEIIAALPFVDVDGSLTYTGGEIADADPDTDNGANDLGIAFDVTGSLALNSAVTGADGDQTLNVSGAGVASFTDGMGAAILDLGSTGGSDAIAVGGAFVGVED